MSASTVSERERLERERLERQHAYYVGTLKESSTSLWPRPILKMSDASKMIIEHTVTHSPKPDPFLRLAEVSLRHDCTNLGECASSFGAQAYLYDLIIDQLKSLRDVSTCCLLSHAWRQSATKARRSWLRCWKGQGTMILRGPGAELVPDTPLCPYIGCALLPGGEVAVAHRSGIRTITQEGVLQKMVLPARPPTTAPGWQDEHISRPSGFACDGVHLFVADYHRSAIHAFRLPDFARVGRLEHTGRPLNEPCGLAVALGRLYVADAGNSRICVFDVRSSPFRFLFDIVSAGHSSPEQLRLHYPCDVAVATRRDAAEKEPHQSSHASLGSRGRLFVVDRDSARISTFDLHDGRRIRTFGGGMGSPYAIAYASGLLLVGDRRSDLMHIFSSTGQPLQTMPLPSWPFGLQPIGGWRVLVTTAFDNRYGFLSLRGIDDDDEYEAQGGERSATLCT